jgi:hypothetical protein
LDVRNVLQVLAAVLTERKVLIVSRNNALLTIVGECFNSLIFPFHYEHVYIPLLPANLIEVVEAPTPYFLGVNSQHLPCDLAETCEGVVVADLDRNYVVVHGEGPPPALPEPEGELLLRRLYLHVHPELSLLGQVDLEMDFALLPPLSPSGSSTSSAAQAVTFSEEEVQEYHTKQLRMSFLLFFASLFADYETCVTSTGSFDTARYLESRQQSVGSVSSSMMYSQSFNQY